MVFCPVMDSDHLQSKIQLDQRIEVFKLKDGRYVIYVINSGLLLPLSNYT